ncbi:MAG: dihydroorotase [Saprospirales bacterium]|nr:MAG: dihydroorotase [Saprospirales bacterium]
MYDLIIKNARLINRGEIRETDLAVKGDRIEKIGSVIDSSAREELDAGGRYLLPGLIDDQVHFREPGLTHKADINTESRAAAAGGVTSFMEMPNTKPPATTLDLLEDKYRIAAESAWVNYSFFMGASNDNLEEVLRTNPREVCGIKVFMGSSTGNMLVDNRKVLRDLFSKCEMLIATHCEDEQTIEKNTEAFLKRFGPDGLKPEHHPQIRSREGCLLSSQMAVELAKECGTRLHVLHISTADETALFEKSPLNRAKKITSEACVHHLYFSDEDYERLGHKIKCNPAIKTTGDREAILRAVLEDRIDVIATDHAPHTAEEKANPYLESPSGLPLVQHSLQMMWQFYEEGKISREDIVRKMCHAPAELFQVTDRGYADEGYMADLVLLNSKADYRVEKSNVLYKCGWSPLEGTRFSSSVERTIVNGKTVFASGQFRQRAGQRLTFSPVH